MSELSEQIAGLSPAKLELLARRLKEKGRDHAPPVQTIPRREDAGRPHAPLSFAQQRLWVLDQLEPGSSAYNMPAAVRLKGHLDVAALEQSFGEIINRHESLRTTFSLVDEQPVQVISQAEPFSLPVVDLSGLPTEEREAEARRLTALEARRPFDLARGPLLRVSVLRLDEEDHALLLTMHHIISDGWSMGVLVREVKMLYFAFSEARPLPLPELPIQYADFAQWQRGSLQGEALEAQANYWKEQLEDAPVLLELPTDRPRPPVQTLRSAKQAFRVSRELSDKLKALSQREGVTLFMTLVASLQALLSRCSGQEHIVVVSASANRNRPEIENLIGYFVNHLVLHTNLSNNPAFGELLGRVRKVCLGAYAHQDLPFDKLLEELQLQRDLSYTPFHQVMFILDVQQDFSISERDEGFAQLSANMAGEGRIGTNVDLYMFLRETEQGLAGSMEYRTDLFDADTVEYLVQSYVGILEKIAAHPEMRLQELELPQELQAKADAARAREEQQTIAVAATFTAEPVRDSLEFWMQQLDLPSAIEFAPYNQVIQQLLDPSSLLARNRRGINVVLVRFEDWLRYQPTTVEADQTSQASAEQEAADVILLERNVRELALALKSASERGATPHLICLSPASPRIAADTERMALFDRLEAELVSELAALSGVFFVGSSELTSVYPVAGYYDPHTDASGHVPYTLPFYTAMGTIIARKLQALRSVPYKVIALDCDQTLWKGVCAEDGVLGLEIDEPRRALQAFMTAQHDAGMLVCLCSKNNEADVLEVFDRRTEMILKRGHLAGWRINWKPKSDNLRSLAEELGVGFDSFIFIDNDPIECAQMMSHCPEVLTLELPQDEALIPAFLKHVWAFDHLRITAEDRRRTTLYRQNTERERFRRESLNLEEYLNGLELQVEINAPSADQLARATQLTQRTNQFNTTTRRRSEAELTALCRNDEQECLVVEVRDRFGDYGLVGVLIFQAGAESIVVETMLLSCRVLGRGVEHQMMVRMGKAAEERGCERVDVLYLPSEKNEPVLNFLESIGAKYREPQAEGYVFRIPSEVAANLSVERSASSGAKAKAQVEQGQADAARTSHSRERSRPKSAVVRQIALQLNDAERILKTIESQKQRVRTEAEGMYVAPRTPIEETLAEVWARLLNISQVGIHDNFFRLGGHSLLGTVMFSRVRDTLEVELPLLTLFEAPTIAALAEVIEQNLIGQSDAGQMAEMMQELAHLSEEEIKALLLSEGAQALGGGV